MAVQKEYNEHAKDNIRRSVWLVVEVPGIYANTVSELEAALKSFADEQIANAAKNTQSFGNTHAVKSGVVEANKLRIFVEKT